MIQTISREEALLVRSLPRIRRCRGWRLYAADGRRFLDLWAEGGRAVMGRKPKGPSLAAKNCIDTGLVSPLPGVWRGRLEKSLLAWKPGYVSACFFPTESEALAALAAFAGSSGARAGNSGPAEGRGGSGSGAELPAVRIERPFGEYLEHSPAPGGIGAPDSGYALGGRVSLALLPLPAGLSFGALLFADSGEAARFREAPASATEGLVPEFRLAAANRAVADMKRFAGEYAEPLWARFDCYIDGIFERRGPWLLPLYPSGLHAGFFKACLEKGILISPDYGTPSLVPGEFDTGEIAPLRSVSLPGE